MTFKQWVDQHFGANGGRKAARAMGVGYSTFRSWYQFERFPRAARCQSIILLSNGLIDLHKWQQEHVTENQKKNKKVSP
ncbi:hypothetical protein [Pseudoalteromonas rhizosphaerae]|uniref:hypothetical protein n=1 Tax=Pseudoalteromonas rhizosphaerae TaxID=2518973 RepID=UPI0012316630|nr:hypothetical protein [Pseudoalteromonas rhizosphaerae]